jgi:hypothetical protein
VTIGRRFHRSPVKKNSNTNIFPPEEDGTKAFVHGGPRSSGRLNGRNSSGGVCSPPHGKDAGFGEESERPRQHFQNSSSRDRGLLKELFQSDPHSPSADGS